MVLRWELKTLSKHVKETKYFIEWISIVRLLSILTNALNRSSYWFPYFHKNSCSSASQWIILDNVIIFQVSFGCKMTDVEQERVGEGGEESDNREQKTVGSLCSSPATSTDTTSTSSPCCPTSGSGSGSGLIQRPQKAAALLRNSDNTSASDSNEQSCLPYSQINRLNKLNNKPSTPCSYQAGYFGIGIITSSSRHHVISQKALKLKHCFCSQLHWLRQGSAHTLNICWDMTWGRNVIRTKNVDLLNSMYLMKKLLALRW